MIRNTKSKKFLRQNEISLQKYEYVRRNWLTPMEDGSDAKIISNRRKTLFASISSQKVSNVVEKKKHHLWLIIVGRIFPDNFCKLEKYNL